MSVVYSYIKSVDDIGNLYDYIKKIFSKVICINNNLRSKTFDVVFPTALTEANKITLDTLIDNYIPVIDVPYNSLTKYCEYYNDSFITLTSSYTPINIGGISYNEDDIYVSDNGYIKFLTIGSFVIVGYINIHNGGVAMLNLYRNGAALSIPYAKVYDNGMFFLPVVDPTQNDYIAIIAKSTTGGYIEYNNCSITIVRSHINLNYKIDDVFYSMNLPSNLQLSTETWTNISFNSIVIKNDVSFDITTGVLTLLTVDNYLMFLSINTDAIGDIKILINDIDTPYLNSNTRNGVIANIPVTVENTTIKFQVKGNALLKECNLLCLRLQASTSLDAYLASILKAKFLNVSESLELTTVANYFVPVPSLTTDITRNDIFISDYVTEGGMFLFYYQLNTVQTDLYFKILINENVYRIVHSNIFNKILQLNTNDTLTLEMYSESGSIVSKGSNMILIKVEPDNIYNNLDYSLNRSIKSPIITNSTSYINILNTYTKKLSIGTYTLIVNGNIIINYPNKQYQINILFDSISIYTDTLLYDDTDQYSFNLKKTIKLITSGIHELHIQIKVLNSNDILTISDLSLVLH